MPTSRPNSSSGPSETKPQPTATAHPPVDPAATPPPTQTLGWLAHELKSPLAEIRAGLGLLRDELVIPSRRVVELIGLLEQQCDRVQSLVHRLIDLRRLVDGRWMAQIEPCDPRAVLEASLADIRGHAARKSQLLEFQCPARPPRILADSTGLGVVIDNLLSNAVKFTPRGGTVRVRLTVPPKQKHIEIAVEDSGPGISPEEQSRLFKEFARLSTRPTAGESSTGLGLALVHHIVRAMHCNVRCESVPGKGARFILTLPRASRPR